MPRLALPFLFALALAGCGSNAEPVDEAAARPDVVIYLIDTLRADHLAPYGEAAARTPHIARLAREGVVFEQASAPAPWTLPSVVSLLTSTFVAEHDVYVDGLALSTEIPTLAEYLDAGGYATLAFFRNPYAGRLSGLDRGFDNSHKLPRQHRERLLAPWLGALRGRPTFFYVHTIEPHDPYFLPLELSARFGEVTEEQRAAFQLVARRYRALTRADFVAKQPLGTVDNAADQRAAVAELDELRPVIDALYAASIEEADRRLGDLIAELEGAGRFDDTLFVLVSDHGEELGEHGTWMHDQSLYEELVHIPLIVRFPGAEFAGRRIATPVSLIDVAPTVLQVVGAAPEAGLRGRSLLPLVDGSAPPAVPRVTAMRHNAKKHNWTEPRPRGHRNVVVRDGTWKAIWNVEPKTLELYDLSTDPTEQTDLAATEPERAERLLAVAKRTLAESTAARAQAVPNAPDAMDEETRSELEMLGYIGGEDE